MNLFKPAPLNTDPEAIAEFNSCNYSIKITEQMALEGTALRKVRILADGIYDLLHYGHLRQIMQAKNAFPKSEVYLIVGVSDEETTHRIKGKTVQNFQERVDTVRHCRYVDEVYPNSPYFATLETLVAMKIDFIAHDALPYVTSYSSDDHYKILRELGMFVTTERTEGVSTTTIINSILRDYDQYMCRNLERGCTREDMNIGYFQETQIIIKNYCSQLLNYLLSVYRPLLTEFLKIFHSKNNIELERNASNSDCEAFPSDGIFNVEKKTQ